MPSFGPAFSQLVKITLDSAPTCPVSTREVEMPSPQPQNALDENLELSVKELLERANLHPPYGEHVIDDLTPQEADDFLTAVVS